MYIYILTNKVNGMQYVGQSVNHPNQDWGRAMVHLSGWEPGCPRIHNAIRKYGEKSFKVDVIYYPKVSAESLNAIETWKIRQLGTLSPNGYNLNEGGCGKGSVAEDVRKKISASRVGITAKEKHPLWGKHHSEYTKQKIRNAIGDRYLGSGNPSIITGLGIVLGIFVKNMLPAFL